MELFSNSIVFMSVYKWNQFSASRFLFLFLVLFEARSHYVAQTGLEPTLLPRLVSKLALIPLPQPPECWEYRRASPVAGLAYSFICLICGQQKHLRRIKRALPLPEPSYQWRRRAWLWSLKQKLAPLSSSHNRSWHPGITIEFLVHSINWYNQASLDFWCCSIHLSPRKMKFWS